MSNIPPITRHDSLLLAIHNVTKKTDKVFLSMVAKPILSKKFGLKSDAIRKIPKFAIVIQGPLVIEDNFTIETIKIYRQLFPDVPLILSTWKDENATVLESIRKLGVYVVLSSYPRFIGVQNINLQIVNTKKGIRFAKSLGCEYVIKTRTDERFYAPNCIDYLYQLLKIFPVAKKTRQNKRILSTSMLSFKYRLYSVSDIFMCGDINDMEAYFSPPLDTRKVIPQGKTVLTHSKERVGEMYLSTRFLKHHGHNPKWTLADSWKTYADRYVIIDHQSIDLYWMKYDSYKENRFLGYSNLRNCTILDFREWLLLYSDLKNKINIPENTLNGQFGDTVSNQKQSENLLLES